MWFIIPLQPLFLLVWWLVRALLYLITCKRVNLFKKKDDAEGGQAVKKVEVVHTHKMTHDHKMTHNHNHKFTESFKIKYMNEAPTNIAAIANVTKPPNVSEYSENASKQFLDFCKENNVEKAFHYLVLVKDINMVSDDKKWSALTIASYNNSQGTVEWLLRNPSIDVNIPTVACLNDGKKWTALMFACRAGHWGIVLRLCQHPNIDVNYQDKNGVSAAHIAARYYFVTTLSS